MMKLDPKNLRMYGKMLLELADAVEDKKVHMTNRDYVRHDFLTPSKFDWNPDNNQNKIVADVTETLLQDYTTCSHNLQAYAFHLVFAWCQVSRQFFINPDASQFEMFLSSSCA